MPPRSPKPPPVLVNAQVLEYAVLDKRVRFSGHSSLFVDGKELGRVPYLVICQNLNEPRALLLHCAPNWTVLGLTEHASPAEARSWAERIYPGVSRRWRKLGVTRQKALQYVRKLSAGRECSFCGKGPNQVNRLIQKGNARICDACVAALHRVLQEGF